MAKSEQVENTTTIGKVDLVRLACKKTEQRLSFDVVSDAYAGLCEAINDCLMNGNTVIIQGIGRFVPIIRPGGEGRNPGTGETIEYGDRLGLKFQVNTNLKLAMREVDIKSLGEGTDSKPVDKGGSKSSTGRGERSSARTEATPSRRGGTGRESAAPARPARRR